MPRGGLPFVACLPCLTGAQRRARRFWSPANPAFGFLSCPHPPSTPFPPGRGSFLMQGASPLHPRRLTACGTYSPCRTGAPAGACLSPSPAYPAFSFFLAPSRPLPRWGRGRLCLFRRGLRPRHPCIRPFAALTVPAVQVPRGGLPFSSPAYPAFSFISTPHPPPPSHREGEFLFYARGFAPCIPATEPARHRFDLPIRHPAGVPSESPTRRKTDRAAFLLAVPAAKERGDRGRWNYPSHATAAFEMVLSPGQGEPVPPGGKPPRRASA